MSLELRSQIYEELSSFDFIDPHTHIDALKPGSRHRSFALLVVE